jgi:hypothetical protein
MELHKMIRISTRMVLLTAVIVGGLIFSLDSKPAQAGSLIGTNMTLEEANPTTNDVNYVWGPFVVGNNPAVTVLNTPGLIPFILDVYGSSATFSFPDYSQAAGGQFNGYILIDNDVTFTNVSLDPSTTLPGFGASRLAYDDHDIYINVTGLFVPGGTSLTVDIASVPEPSSLVLAVLSCGLVAVWASRRHLRSVA